MPLPDSNYDVLSQIITKVRRLTRAPSSAQLTDLDIRNYINNFILYDFPGHLSLFSQRDVFTFYSEPFVDVYETDTTNPASVFYNFNNRYISLHPPFYSAGYLGLFSQSRQEFFGIYPKINTIQQIGTGDGVTAAYAGTIPGMGTSSSTCIVRNTVVFDSVATSGIGLTLVDRPGLTPNSGDLVIPTNDPSSAVSQGSINYITGVYTFTFTLGVPASGTVVNSQVFMTQASMPRALLFYDNKITLRPVPDQPYQLSLEAYIRPTELLLSTQEPEVAQWWQYIAYGASKKVFEDRMDMDSVSMIMPEFKKQELLVLRPTIAQNTNDRVATIYTDKLAGSGNFGGFGSGLF